MTDIWLKRHGLSLVPCDDEGLEYVKKLGQGKQVRAKITRPRNVAFHRKFFALLDYAFDCFEPQDVEIPQHLSVRGIVPEKNRERFRKDLIILAGFYHATIRVDGEIRVEADSISFANMDDDTFADLYQKTIDVVLKHVLKNFTEEELRVTVDGILEFA